MDDIIFNDNDESYCEGDVSIEDIDWEQVAELERRQQAVLELPDDERPTAMLGLLHEMHGDELQVL